MLFKIQMLFWLYVSAVVVALFVVDTEFRLITSVTVLASASRLFRAIWRAAERNGASVALQQVWVMASIQEESQGD